MKLLLVLALLVAASPALAADQWQECSAAHEAGVAITSADKLFLRPPTNGVSSLCYDTDGTADSPVLNVASCENVDALLFNMTNATTNDLAVSILSCPDPSCTGGGWKVQNLTMDGDASTNTEAIYGFAAQWLKVDWTTNTDTDDMRVVIRCN